MGVNPVDNPGLYDQIILAGKPSPGRCKITGLPTRDEGWEKQETKGQDGGETVHNGRKLVEFEVELYLWKERAKKIDHFAGWEEWKKILEAPVKKNAPKALDVYHPQLDGLGVTSVVANTWTEPVPDGKGGATVKIKFLQYSPSKPKASAKPGGSKSKDDKGPDPNQDLKDQIKDKTAEFNSL